MHCKSILIFNNYLKIIIQSEFDQVYSLISHNIAKNQNIIIIIKSTKIICNERIIKRVQMKNQV